MPPETPATVGIKIWDWVKIEEYMNMLYSDGIYNLLLKNLICTIILKLRNAFFNTFSFINFKNEH